MARLTGMRAFLTVWLGQMISLTGSGLTSFALGVWVYQKTGSITDFALIAVFAVLPGILISPFAGALVDRWDRRLAMIMSNTGAALGSVTVTLLLIFGDLQVGWVYLAVAITSSFNAFGQPALTAAVTQLVSKEHYGRANGLLQLGQGVAQLIAPVMAGALLQLVGLKGLVILDVTTFLIAIITLFLVSIPRPEPSVQDQRARGSLLREAKYGWTYIMERPGLVALLFFLASVNFMIEMTYVLFTPMVLTFTTPAVLGTMLSIGGSGMLIGGMVMSAWGGPRRRINGVFTAGAVIGLSIAVVGLQPSVVPVTVAGFLVFLFYPILASSSAAIWQQKVAPDVQGRVFAFRRMVNMSTQMVAYLVAGPLADKVFEPLLRPDGALAGSVGSVIGVGQGRGIGFLFIVMGSLLVVATVLGYFYPRLRNVAEELPDAQREAASA